MRMLRVGCLAFMLASPVCALAEDRALIIGIEGYPRLDLRLAPQSAKDDAVAMAQLAVEEWGYTQAQTSLLLGSAATSDAILNAVIDELVGLTAPGDRALLYFAGIGSRNTQGQRVIMAYDSESLLGRIPEDALSDILDLIADRRVTVIVDAGFSGDINIPGQRGIGPPGFESSPFLANGDRRTVYAPAAATQTAWETAAGGVMTSALVQGARGTADADRDGVLTHAELYRFIAAQSQIWCDGRDACAATALTPDFAGALQGGPMLRAPIQAAANVAATNDLPNPARLGLTIDGGTALTIGQSVTFRVKSAAAGSFVLLDIAPDGTLAQVYPSTLAPGTRIPPNAEVTIPAPVAGRAPLRVRVTGPIGEGLLVAVLVPGDQTDLASLLPQVMGGNRTDFLKQIAATLDALAANAGVPWSATTLPYTIKETK